MNKWVKIFAGLVLLIGVILVCFYTLQGNTWDFGKPAWELLKGGVVWGLITLAILLILLGISELKE